MTQKIALSLAICAISLPVAGQKISASDVPPTVITSFNKNFPGITPQWEYEDGKFDGEFHENGHKVEAIFDRRGNMSVGIDLSATPAAMKNYLDKNYKNSRIRKLTKMATITAEVTYAVRAGNKELLFDANGKFVKSAPAGSIIPVEKD